MIIIPEKIIQEQYVCEICGFTSTKKDEVIECEKRGVPTPLAKEGDKIYFMDCDNTPIYYEFISDNEYMKNLYRDNKTLYNHIRTSFCVGNRMMKWVIAKIEIYHHQIIYYLKTESGKNFYYSDYTSENQWSYPVIKSNKLMQGILDKYNK